MTPPLELQVFTSPAHTLRDGHNTFSPTTATLVAGSRDAVLVDTLFVDADITALGDMIEASGRRLTAVYITHGHADHYFGLGQLLERFPSARAVAAREIAEYIEASVEAEVTAFQRLFDELVTPTVLPAALDGDVLELEDQELRVIHVGQGDIKPSTSLHVPSIDAVIAGDVAYNQIHQMMAFGGPEEWQAWSESVEKLEALKPRVVVAGHKRPEAPDDDAHAILHGTRSYLEDFAGAVAAGLPAREIVAVMTEKYPGHGNLTTLRHSAAMTGNSVAT